MGNTNSTQTSVILLTGLEKSGKSLFLKKLLELRKKEKEITQLEPTLGFNYITIDYSNQSYHIWELGGDSVSSSYWSTFYRNIATNMVLFIVNIFDEQNHQLAMKEFLKLVNEEELKIAKFILIFNLKIDDKSKRFSFNEQDYQEVKLKVDFFLMQIQDSPIHDYDNRVFHFIFDISKLKEGEFNSMRMLNKCFMIKEKEIS